MSPETLQKTLSALGLCRRAGKCVFGTEAVCEDLRKHKILFAVCPEDNSENTQKKLCDKCGFYRVELLMLPIGGEVLARALGKTGHCAAVGVTDPGFLNLLRKTLSED